MSLPQAAILPSVLASLLYGQANGGSTQGPSQVLNLIAGANMTVSVSANATTTATGLHADSIRWNWERQECRASTV